MNLKLKARIVEKFGTQSDFAPVIDTDESLISKIVRGRRTLPVEKQVEWAAALGTTPRELFGREELNG